MAEKETWKFIKGYEGMFKISNLGRCMSVARKQNSIKIHKNQPVSFLTPQKDKNNFFKYWYFQLFKDGKRSKKPIHRLVAEYFIKNPKKYKYVLFRDGDLNNYSIENLEWYPTNLKKTLTNK